MTTISSSTSALSSLLSLYGSEDGAGGTLTSAQTSSVVGLVEGGTSSAATGIDALLGQSSTATSPTDLTAILDEIEAQKAATTSAADTASTTASTATSQQQKAASLMQSVYQAQAANLFTLLG